MIRIGKTNNRRGAAGLTVVLVCIGVIGALIFASLQTSLRQRRQLDRELQMEQTRWLAEAGLDHAMTLIEFKDELAEDPIVIKPELDQHRTAEVTIEFKKAADAVEVNVSAWIGLVDRPETQTRQMLSEVFGEQQNEKFDNTSEE